MLFEVVGLEVDDAADVFGVADDFRLRLVEDCGIDGFREDIALDMLLFANETTDVLSA